MSRILAVFVLFAATLSSQTVTGSLEGRITDPSGAVVPAVEISVVAQETGLTRRTLTNELGYFQLTFLPIGVYTVSARAKGFAESKRDALVQLNSTKAVDFLLKPATVSTEIVVTDEAPLLESAKGEVKSSLDEKTIEDRPLPSRNFLSLVEQMPGFQSSGGYSGVNNPTLSSGSYVVFNGTGSRSATFQIDGVNNDDSSEGINRQNVNISSIKEFAVLTNAYSAEFGRGGSVVLVQTKSGTNRMHGDAYEFLQNEKLNSNSFFNNALGRNADGTLVARRAPYRRNQFGYTFGAPIIKNKLFLFHSFEQTKLRQYATVRRFVFLPSEKIQVGTCRLCVNPEQHPNLDADVKFLQSILDRYPKVEPNAASVCDHCYVQTVGHRFPDEDYSGRLDWLATQRDTATVRYQYSRQKRRPGELVRGEAAVQNNKQDNIGLTQTHIFTPLTSGEFRFAVGRRWTLVDISDGNSTPVVRISNPSPYGGPTIGNAGAFPINRRQRDFQFNYNVSHVRGRHTLKAGADVRRQHLDDLADNFSRGWWTFAATGLLGSPDRYEGWENFLRGYASFQKGYGNVSTENRLGEVNLYALDDFRVSQRLTLNLGFRYERVLSPDEVQGRIRYGYNDFSGLQPRFGFAWIPTKDGRMAVRGGFGIYHSRIFQSVFSQGGASLRSQPPYGVYRSYNASFETASPDGGYVYDGNFNPGRIDIGRVAPDLGMPAIHQYNLTVDRQFGKDMLLSVGYNRTRGIGLMQNDIENRAKFPGTDPVTGIVYDKVDSNLGNTAPAPGFISIAQPRTNQRRPDARYGSVYYIHNGSWSYYNALRVEFKKRYSKGFHWSVAYALSKSIDTGSDVTAGSPLTERGGARSLRGLSDFDQRNRVNVNYGYQLPWFNSGRGLTRQVLGGWTISGNNTFASGNPFSVTAGYDVNADGVANDRAILLDQSLFGRSVDDGRQDPATGTIISMLQLPLAGFFPNRLVPTAQRAFDPGGTGKDTLGRNTFFGSGIKNWDMAVTKSFGITESHRLTFRAEMYNVTNTVRFAFPSASIQSATFGRISSAYNPQNFVGASRADDTSRVMQMALRYVF
jgi:hypothetical protein